MVGLSTLPGIPKKAWNGLDDTLLLRISVKSPNSSLRKKEPSRAMQGSSADACVGALECAHTETPTPTPIANPIATAASARCRLMIAGTAIAVALGGPRLSARIHCLIDSIATVIVDA